MLFRGPVSLIYLAVKSWILYTGCGDIMPSLYDCALLIDFGSTFTKVTVVDLKSSILSATSAAPTTHSSGLISGLREALASLNISVGSNGIVNRVNEFRLRLACSSAAGGLRMITIGLVPELTAKAARMAALGAGAKVIKTYSHELNDDEIDEIVEASPDIVLLAGGTDGGNKDVLRANARRLALSSLSAPIVIAGNKVVAREVEACLQKAGKDARIAPNVMPAIGRLEVDGARSAIRSIFIERIVQAKGLDDAVEFLEGGVLMPTPAAVLEAAKLLADGIGGRRGYGDILVVDPGGATTDVYSVCDGHPASSGVTVRGLPEPRVKRTVEGDLGVRHSCISLAQTIGYHRLAEWTGHDEASVEREVEELPGRADYLPEGEFALLLDDALARGAVLTSVNRHAGRLEEVYTPLGLSYIQRGKDLASVSHIVGTGGPIIHSANPKGILELAQYSQSEPDILRPKSPGFLVDAKYIMSAMGLLAQIEPSIAYGILKRELLPV